MSRKEGERKTSFIQRSRERYKRWEEREWKQEAPGSPDLRPFRDREGLLPLYMRANVLNYPQSYTATGKQPPLEPLLLQPDMSAVVYALVLLVLTGATLSCSSLAVLWTFSVTRPRLAHTRGRPLVWGPQGSSGTRTGDCKSKQMFQMSSSG